MKREMAAGAPVGMLLCPNAGNLAPAKGAWAADNSAFSGFNAKKFLQMLAKIEGRADCLWVTAPDVVADAASTDALFRYWAKIIRAHRLKVAYVGQDGMTSLPDADAFFIGGSTDWKLGHEAATWAKVAKEQGMLVHMGRVNSLRRLRYAQAIGCDSVDGSSFSRFSRTHIPWASEALRQRSLSELAW